MTQIYPILSKPVSLRVLVPLSMRNSGHSVRSARPLTLALATGLLIATAIAPVAALAELPVQDSAPVMGDQLDIEEEDPDSADDGSSALPDTFRLYDLRGVEPISAKEEEALLGNWGDGDTEDGD